MILEDIGFYTLSDARAAQASSTSPLWRVEVILTAACNFNCPYCRGFQDGDRRTLGYGEVVEIIDACAEQRLRNLRFSGGEPTLWPWLADAVAYARRMGVERVAISTNGSADLAVYRTLVGAGCNDFSISLDACCASTARAMAGSDDVFETVTGNIRELAAFTYVTVGIVLTSANIAELEQIILLASDELGVDDIRIIPAARDGDKLPVPDVPRYILARHPILRYRTNNLRSGRAIRGLNGGTSRCPLVLDDMAILNGYHYPCVIYMREWGKPIGTLNGSVRKDRERWFNEHDCSVDPICSRNCLDVCVDYNKTWERLHP